MLAPRLNYPIKRTGTASIHHPKQARQGQCQARDHGDLWLLERNQLEEIGKFLGAFFRTLQSSYLFAIVPMLMLGAIDDIRTLG